MARKIDDDTIIRINELYLEIGVKSKVAQMVGVSPSTVSKYIIPDYKPAAAEPEAPVEFDKPIPGAAAFVNLIKSTHMSPTKAFCLACMLTEEEWDGVREIQKGVNI